MHNSSSFGVVQNVRKVDFMRRFVLYHPSSGTYVSSVSYDRSNRQYLVKFTNKISELKIWSNRSYAESQAQRIFASNRNLSLEVKEIR